MTTLSNDLTAAYRQANYRILDGSGFIFHIDKYCATLQALHMLHCADCSAFITACNPNGIMRTLDENQAAHVALTNFVRQSGWSFLEGIGEDPSGLWPGEPSLLIFGMALVKAMQIGIQFQQNAIVWCGQTAIPELLLLK